MAKQNLDLGLKPFRELNPWRVAMLPTAFRAYQDLSSQGRQWVLDLKQELALFPPDKRRFELRLDLNAPLLRVRALSEPHLTLSLNAEYQLLRGECVIVHLAEKAGKGRREKRRQAHVRPPA